jgi:hypothetical protein
MSFQQYQSEIRAAINANTKQRLDLFCYDVVARMLPFVDATDKSDLLASEIVLVNKLRQEFNVYPVDWKKISEYLDSLNGIEQDDNCQWDNDLPEFLDAIGNWQYFVKTGSKDAVALVSEQIMNLLDCHYTEDQSLENWLTVPEIKSEFDKQIGFLQTKPTQ